jgi:hypothetical protein
VLTASAITTRRVLTTADYYKMLHELFRVI